MKAAEGEDAAISAATAREVIGSIVEQSMYRREPDDGAVDIDEAARMDLKTAWTCEGSGREVMMVSCGVLASKSRRNYVLQ